MIQPVRRVIDYENINYLIYRPGIGELSHIITANTHKRRNVAIMQPHEYPQKWPNIAQAARRLRIFGRSVDKVRTVVSADCKFRPPAYNDDAENYLNSLERHLARGQL